MTGLERGIFRILDRETELHGKHLRMKGWSLVGLAKEIASAIDDRTEGLSEPDPCGVKKVDKDLERRKLRLAELRDKLTEMDIEMDADIVLEVARRRQPCAALDYYLGELTEIVGQVVEKKKIETSDLPITPGGWSWAWVRRAREDRIPHLEVAVDPKCDYMRLADVYGISDEDAEGNARAIAALPKLLRASADLVNACFTELFAESIVHNLSNRLPNCSDRPAILTGPIMEALDLCKKALEEAGVPIR